MLAAAKAGKRPQRKEQMKRLAFSVGLLTALTSTTIQAQSMDLRANIPFEFRIGETRLPAGEYLIQQAASVLIVKEQGANHKAAMLFTTGAFRLDPLKTGEVEFNRYGDTYFLAKIWLPANRQGRAVIKTPQEKELAAEARVIGKVGIALQRK
jgi:hypothetical protein